MRGTRAGCQEGRPGGCGLYGRRDGAMGRMTERDASGRWQAKGIPWENLRKGETMTEETSQILYGCLCKLKDYEDSGMDPDQVGSLKLEAEDMAAYVCDKLCRHPREMADQEELDGACGRCPLDAYVKRVSATGQGKGGEQGEAD